MLKYFLNKWTLIHFAFWLVAGANYAWHNISSWVAVIITGVGAVAWELIEQKLEKKGWVSGREHFLDRWIADIVVAYVGAFVGFSWIEWI